MKMKGNSFIKISGGCIDANLDIYIYTNDGFKIVYSPALDLMGYGKTVKDAQKSFEVVISDFFESSLKRGTLDEYLISTKWVRESKTEEFVSPQVVSLVKSNNQFQEILSSNRFSKKTIPYNYSFC